MKTNFNSIVKQKFLLKSLIITFNISLTLENEKINIINDFQNFEKKSDSINDKITSCCSSKSSITSIKEKDSQDNNYSVYLNNSFKNNNINTFNNNNLYKNSDNYSIKSYQSKQKKKHNYSYF